MKKLGPGEFAEFIVDAKEQWNASAIELEPGSRYELRAKVVEGEEWKDSGVRSTLSGGWRGPAKILERAARLRARARRLPMYCLVGSIGKEPSTFFLIGDSAVLDASMGGELHGFANDWPGRYGNNHGRAAVTIRRLA